MSFNYDSLHCGNICDINYYGTNYCPPPALKAFDNYSDLNFHYENINNYSNERAYCPSYAHNQFVPR